ncbi:Uncharacterized protein TCM_024731 [Theobroma cacao]|uniref:Uncharacterized protein n=1 Tax=Theobroma cacao TaxID=3641 RepID=A0A061EWY3_THECC|nr:Uncharacterized protein TCM_024731 [Theobroma cacao]
MGKAPATTNKSLEKDLKQADPCFAVEGDGTYLLILNKMGPPQHQLALSGQMSGSLHLQKFGKIFISFRLVVVDCDRLNEASQYVQPPNPLFFVTYVDKHLL